ncbi:MAG: hypothetical protein U0930_06540 [Pirellulales bacterium]
MKHGKLLSRLHSRGKSELIPPFSMIGQDQHEGNPTQYLLVVAPLTAGKEPAGMIEVFQRPDSAPNVQKGYQRFLEQMAALIGEWLKGHNLPASCRSSSNVATSGPLRSFGSRQSRRSRYSLYDC